MQAYQNVTPPFSLSSGDVGFSFNNEAFPAANTAGSQFALPSFTGISDGGTAVRWQTIFGTAPSSGLSIVLQGATADVDAEYQQIDATTNTQVKLAALPPCKRNFCESSCLLNGRRRLDRQNPRLAPLPIQASCSRGLRDRGV
jgi:hypothetical protein